MERKFCINWQGISAEVKYQRKKRHITQKHLALMAQVSAPTISKIENGSEDIELSSVLHILQVLGLLDKRNLMFPDKKEHYNSQKMIIEFYGVDGDKKILCAISDEALVDNFKGKNNLQRFRNYRSEIEHLARRKYLYNELESDGSVLIQTMDLM